MARNVYSFVKVTKQETKKGVYVTALGVGAIICLLILVIASFVKAGQLPAVFSAFGYLSFIAAIVGLRMSIALRKDYDVYGQMVDRAIYVNGAAVILHVLIFLIGCFSMAI